MVEEKSYMVDIQWQGWTDISVSRYIWLIPIHIPIYRYRQMGYRYRPYLYRYLYRLIWISVISVSAKYRLKYMDIGQNIGIYRPKASYRLNIGQNDNIGIGIGDRYVGSNISVSAKISAGIIYRYLYRLNPYQSNPRPSGTRSPRHSSPWALGCQALGRQALSRQAVSRSIFTHGRNTYIMTV